MLDFVDLEDQLAALLVLAIGAALVFAGALVAAGRRLRGLQDRERRLCAALNATSQSIVVLRPDGTVLALNQAAQSLTGGPEGLIGRPIWDAAWLPEHGEVRSHLRIAVAEAAAGSAVHHEIALHGAGGEVAVINLTLKPVLGPNGEVELLVAEGRDISMRRNAEEQLRQAQKMEAVGQLTGGIAHDFNNILTAVISNLELLRDMHSPGMEGREHTDAALQAAMSGATLTQRLLAFSRKQPLNPRLLDLNALIESMKTLLSRSCGENISLRTHLDPNLRPLLADRNQLENALLNLVLNARDAMPAGGLLRIETANRKVAKRLPAGELPIGEYVALTVSDDGIGMPPEVISHIFEPFFTTKRIGQGTGLGLSMVYGFVKQSGGHVTVLSELGHGASLTLYFPAAEGEVEAVAEESGRPATEPAPPAAILVVEDDDLVRLSTVQILEQLGFRPREAGTARDALELLDRHPEIELLFTDIGLPGMNGHQLAAEARRRRPGLKVLFATGYDRYALDDRLRPDPTTALLAKPYLARDLAQALETLLNSVPGEAGSAA